MYCSRCGKKQIKKNQTKSYFARELEKVVGINKSRAKSIIDTDYLCPSCEKELEVLKKTFNV